MKFLIDRCAGRKLAEWLRALGHDVTESRLLGPDPGDRALLQWAVSEKRILVTLDTDFGELVYKYGKKHCGIIRLPDVRYPQRIELMGMVLNRYRPQMENGAIITIRGQRIRISA